MKCLSICTLLLLSLPISGNAQDTLSPQIRLRLLADWKKTTNSDSKRLSSLYRLAESLSTTLPDSSLSLAKKGLELSKKKGEFREIGQFLFMTGYSHHYLGNSNESLRYFSAAAPYYRKWDNKEEQGAFFWNLGNTWFRNSNYRKCLESYLFSLKIRESLRDTIGIMQCTNNIGLVYEQQNRISQAKAYFLRTLDLARKSNDEKWIGITTFNVSNSYRDEKNYDKALSYLKQALIYAKKGGKERFIGNTITGFGDLYFDQKSYTVAKDYYLQAGEYLRKVTDKTELALWCLRMGDVCYELRQYPQSIAYCDSAIKMRRGGPPLDYERFAHQTMAKSYEQMGNYQLAYSHQLRFQTITDSLHNADNTRQLADIRIRFELEQQEAALKNEADRKSSEQQSQRNSIIGICACILLLTLLLINRSRLKQKNRHQKELNQLQKEQASAVFSTAELERKRIAQDLHDGLGQLISIAKLNLQRHPDTSSELIQNSVDLMDKASAELRQISFNLMPYSMEEFGLAGTVKELISRLERSNSIVFRLYISGIERKMMSPEAEMHIYRIIQEAITNSLRYAEANEIGVHLLRDDDKLLVTIEDDGKGFDKCAIVDPGMGLRNMHSRTVWLKGEIAIDSSPGTGTVITLELPL